MLFQNCLFDIVEKLTILKYNNIIYFCVLSSVKTINNLNNEDQYKKD